jgi:transcriptional regulator with XRE-family HTH domain
MPKKKPVQQLQREETFGERLLRLRQQAGFSQRELGEQLGLSQRMVAYYEGQSSRAPDHLLAPLADVFGITTDELLGVKKRRAQEPKPSNLRLWRRFRQIEKLPARERKQLLAIVDAILERHELVLRHAS